MSLLADFARNYSAESTEVRRFPTENRAVVRLALADEYPVALALSTAGVAAKRHIENSKTKHHQNPPKPIKSVQNLQTYRQKPSFEHDLNNQSINRSITPSINQSINESIDHSHDDVLLFIFWREKNSKEDRPTDLGGTHNIRDLATGGVWWIGRTQKLRLGFGGSRCRDGSGLRRRRRRWRGRRPGRQFRGNPRGFPLFQRSTILFEIIQVRLELDIICLESGCVIGWPGLLAIRGVIGFPFVQVRLKLTPRAPRCWRLRRVAASDCPGRLELPRNQTDLPKRLRRTKFNSSINQSINLSINWAIDLNNTIHRSNQPINPSSAKRFFFRTLPLLLPVFQWGEWALEY